MNREKESLLLYLESRIVDNQGFVDPRHMNDVDFKQAREWHEKGFIVFRRIPFELLGTFGKSTNYVKFSPEAWRITHRLRKVRGARQLRKQKTALLDVDLARD